MKKWAKRVCMIVLAVAVMLPLGVALAANLTSPAVIVDDLDIGVNPSSVYGMCFEPNNQTFYANGRHWIFYDNNDSDLVYKTAPPNGTFGAEVELVATSGLYGWEFGVWYDKSTDTVHMARHNMTPDPDEVQYRMGTPNADGTITWAAAWQTVAQVPADLDNWRTFITVDENGYPWVGWIDTDGTNDFGILYVESSSTNDGTWVEDVAQSFGSGGTATDGTGTMTGSPVALDIGLNQPTVTVAGTFIIDVPIGGSGTAATNGWVVAGSPVALVEGENTITVNGGGAGVIDITMALNEHAWFGSITPIGTGDDVVEVQWSAENIATDDVGLYASVYDSNAGTWSTRDTVVAEGSMHEVRWDAFSFYDLGSAMWVVYEDVLGAVMCRARSQIQTWGTSDAAVAIAEDAEAVYLVPTISGYQENVSGTGEDLICIVNSDTYIKYSILYYGGGTDDWTSWVYIWYVPDVANDFISRHIASYKYGSPLSFAWQWTDDSESEDTIMYWWIENGQLGWYEGLPNSVAPLADMVVLIFLGLAILVFLAIVFADNLNVKMMIYLAIGVLMVLAFLAAMNTQVINF